MGSNPPGNVRIVKVSHNIPWRVKYRTERVGWSVEVTWPTLTKRERLKPPEQRMWETFSCPLPGPVSTLCVSTALCPAWLFWLFCPPAAPSLSTRCTFGARSVTPPLTAVMHPGHFTQLWKIEIITAGKGFQKGCLPKWAIKGFNSGLFATYLLPLLLEHSTGLHDRLSAVRRISLFGDRRLSLDHSPASCIGRIQTLVVTDVRESRPLNRCCVIFGLGRTVIPAAAKCLMQTERPR